VRPSHGCPRDHRPTVRPSENIRVTSMVRIAVTEQCRTQRLIKDSVLVNLLEETAVVKDMAAREKRKGCRIPRSLSVLPDYVDSSRKRNGSPITVRESIL
jgi:hypothetical protein